MNELLINQADLICDLACNAAIAEVEETINWLTPEEKQALRAELETTQKRTATLLALLGS